MIPVSTPLLYGNEKKYLCQAIDEGEVSGEGKFVRRFEEAFAKWAGTKYAVAVSSGTAALEVAIWAMDLKKVSIPAGTIISCLVAAKRVIPIINLHDNEIKTKIHELPIMRVHLFGRLDKNQSMICVDDCSQYWAKFKHYLMSCYSLYANKLITSGEGGIIVTSDRGYYERARLYRNLSHSPAERFVHEYEGYNFRMSNLQAAVALAQLERIDEHIEIKRQNRDLYKKYLPEEVNCMFDVDVPWMYLVGTSHDAGDMVNHMETLGSGCRRFFLPLHRQPCVTAEATGNHPGFPIADTMRKFFFYLPSGLTLNDKEIKKTCKNLAATLKYMKNSTAKSRTKEK